MIITGNDHLCTGSSESESEAQGPPAGRCGRVTVTVSEVNLR